MALTMLGRDKAAAARRFATALEAAGRLGPEARQLALARPLDILGAGEDWPLLLELAAWVRDYPRPGIYPSQIPVAGVHTKVLEQHRPLLSRLLDVVLPIGSVDASTTAFAARDGFLTPARRVRLRGDARLLGVPAEGTADVVWDVAALAALDPDGGKVTDLLVLENQVSFLTAPMGPGRLVVCGVPGTAPTSSSQPSPGVDVAPVRDGDTADPVRAPTGSPSSTACGRSHRRPAAS